MFIRNNFPAWNLFVRVLQKSFSMPPKNVRKSSKWVAKTSFRHLIHVETTFCFYWDYACHAETSMTFLGFAIWGKNSWYLIWLSLELELLIKVYRFVSVYYFRIYFFCPFNPLQAGICTPWKYQKSWRYREATLGCNDITWNIWVRNKQSLFKEPFRLFELDNVIRATIMTPDRKWKFETKLITQYTIFFAF